MNQGWKDTSIPEVFGDGTPVYPWCLGTGNLVYLWCMASAPSHPPKPSGARNLHHPWHLMPGKFNCLAKELVFELHGPPEDQCPAQ